MTGVARSAPGSSWAAPLQARLGELRSRVRNAGLAFIVGFLVAYAFAEELFVLLALPLLHAWQDLEGRGAALGAPTLYFSSLTEPFWAYLRQSAWAGAFLAAPVIFHQFGALIAPRWYARSRWSVVSFAAVATLFFVIGAAFCYVAVMPLAFQFFLGYSTHAIPGVGDVAAGLQPRLFIADYMSFARAMLLGFGVVFELPVAIYALVRAGLVTPRGLWRFNRWAIILAFTVAAVLTPGPDVVSQLLMAVPLVALYNLSIVVAYVVVRRRAAAQPSTA